MMAAGLSGLRTLPCGGKPRPGLSGWIPRAGDVPALGVRLGEDWNPAAGLELAFSLFVAALEQRCLSRKARLHGEPRGIGGYHG
ncbi:hypothetical protein MTO96_010042 [Rhipicephalus appendiculatus]